jgi:CubicO group peptidase (beta-lactamase class C family)
MSVAATSASAAQLSKADLARIEALEQRVVAMPGPQAIKGVATIGQRMSEAGVPAVSVAFIENGKVSWSRTFGEVLAGSCRQASPETLFQAASLSKAVTAAAALRMVDMGQLSLDRDVLAQLKGWRLPNGTDGPAITLRQLLSHTAGLSVAGYPGYAAGGPVPTLAESLAGAGKTNTPALRLFAAPGGQMAYSGGGYSVVQLLMTEASGQSFETLADRILLRPAGMNRSSFQQPLSAAQKQVAARAHDAQGRPVAGGGHIYPELAAAGLWTTAADYARFLIAIQDSWAGGRGALLRSQTARAMVNPVMSNYGLGVVAAGPGGRWFITHGGSNEGFQCRFAAFLDGSRQGVVIMTNSENGGRLAAAIQRTLAQAYGWPEAQLPPTPRAPA